MVTGLTQATAETVAPASVASTPPTRQANLRFAFVYAALGLILLGSFASFAVFGLWPGLHPSTKWSSWKPRSGPPLVMAKEIANYVAPKYRFANGGQLVAAVASAPAVTAGTQNIGIVAVSTRSKTGAKQTVRPLAPGTTVMYTLCGLGARCAIATGKPTVPRGRLVRREGLEMALYTFKYIPRSTPSSSTCRRRREPRRPPSSTSPGRASQGRLGLPLKQTLPLATPPRAGQDDPTEAAVLDALTLPHLYASGLVQLQIGGALLALVHVS